MEPTDGAAGLHAQGLQTAVTHVVLAAEAARGLYLSALDAPSIDSDEDAVNLANHAGALLTDDTPLQRALATALAHEWQILNFSMIVVIYGVLGEGAENPQNEPSASDEIIDPPTAPARELDRL